MAALGGSVARRYARAMFEVAAAQGKATEFGGQIDAVAGVFQSAAELRQALSNPVFKEGEKRRILEAVLAQAAVAGPVRSFLLLLLDRGRFGSLPAIARAYREMADEHAGQVRATITSASPLDTLSLDRLRQALEKRMGKKVLVETAVDPDLIGGVVARVGDLVLDGSVRARLGELREKLLN